jgi:dTDP-4-amino-4,6-dideoxygalactose transaminase
MKKIPFFNYQYFCEKYKNDLNNIFNDVLSRGAFILQRDLEEFEAQISEYLGVKHAIGVGNCTDGLQLALMAAGVKAGDEVIFPSHTFVATAGAIKSIGASPIPVECGNDHLIDPKDIETNITERTKAILPVQLNGRTCDMDAIKEIASRHDLLIIEDAAQSFGAKYKGVKTGTFGLAAAFSFYPAKVLPCLGDGGCVVTNSDDIAREVRFLRNHGRNEDGSIAKWGINSRLDNLQAAFLKFFLSIYDEFIEKRRHIATIYHDRLGDVSEIVLPPAPSDVDYFDVFQNFEVEFDSRGAIEQYLLDNGVHTLKQWGGKAVHEWEGLRFNKSLLYTENVMRKSLLIPMNISLEDDDIHYICDIVEKFYSCEFTKSVKETTASLNL